MKNKFEIEIRQYGKSSILYLYCRLPKPPEKSAQIIKNIISDKIIPHFLNIKEKANTLRIDIKIKFDKEQNKYSLITDQSLEQIKLAFLENSTLKYFNIQQKNPSKKIRL